MELVARIPAVSDTGEHADVLEYAHQTRVNLLAGGGRVLDGAREYFLDDGRDMNWLADDLFEIVVTGERLWRVE